MSSTASILANTQPCNVTAWSYDVSIQILKNDITKLKVNPTPTNREQIIKKENSIAEKKVALEKHCRQFSITYGKYGTEKSEVKLEPTNGEVKAEAVDGEVKAEPITGEAGAVANAGPKDVPISFVEVPVPSVEIDKMEVDSSVLPIDAATDAVNAAALDEITFPPVTDMVNNHDIPNVIHSPQPHQSSMAAQDLINHDFSFGSHVGAAIDDPFITSPGNGTAPANHFALSPSSHVDHFTSFDDIGDDYTPAHVNNNASHAGSANYTAGPLATSTEPLAAQDGVFNDIQDFGASAAPVRATGFKSEDEDEEMGMDAPTIEHAEEIMIPGMEKYDNL